MSPRGESQQRDALGRYTQARDEFVELMQELFDEIDERNQAFVDELFGARRNGDNDEEER